MEKNNYFYNDINLKKNILSYNNTINNINIDKFINSIYII